MKPIIGIVSNVSKNTLISCDSNAYENVITKVGGISNIIMPIRIKNGIKENDKKYLERQIDLCDAILLQGGNSWSYHEYYCLKYALKKDMPVLGICLGMQLMANYVSNHEDIKDRTIRINNIINHKQPSDPYVHSVSLKRNSKLAGIFNKTTIFVNSNHNYMVFDNKKISVGYSKDRVVEAIEIPDRFFAVGVQWHPEKMYDYDLNARLLFKAFINKAIIYNKIKILKSVMKNNGS